MRLIILPQKYMLVSMLICLLQASAAWADDKILTYPGLPSTAWQSSIDQNGNVTVTVDYNTWEAYRNDKIWSGNTLTISNSIHKLIISGGNGKSLIQSGINLECHAALSFPEGSIDASPTSNFYGKVDARFLTIRNNPTGQVTFHAPVTITNAVTINNAVTFKSSLNAASLQVTNDGASSATFQGAVNITGDVKIEQQSTFNGTLTVGGNLSVSISGQSDATFNKDVFVKGTTTVENGFKFNANFITDKFFISDNDKRAMAGLCASLDKGAHLGTDIATFFNISGSYFDIKVQGTSILVIPLKKENGNSNTLIPNGSPIPLETYLTQNKNNATLQGYAPCLRKLATSMLPARLLHFSAARTPMGVAISWRVDRDELLSFQVERSEDGHIFLPLTSLSGIYTYTDAQAPASALWYRLRISNPKGEYLYSTAMQISPQVSQGLQVAVSPNPLQNGRLQAYIRSDRPFGQLQLRLTDLQGRLLGQQTLRTDAGGQAQWSMDVATSSGMLLLMATDGQNAQTVKVLVQ